MSKKNRKDKGQGRTDAQPDGAVQVAEETGQPVVVDVTDEGQFEPGDVTERQAVVEETERDEATEPIGADEAVMPEGDAIEASSEKGRKRKAKAEGARAETDEPPVNADEVEAILMTVDKPLPEARVAQILGRTGTKGVREAVKTLNEFYKSHDRSFRIEQVAGGLQIMTLPKYKELLANLHKARVDNKLSSAALETLAIIAYRQPILRTDLESIRGVSCGEVLRSLMDKHLVKIVGRAEELGRPMLYGTTRNFLEVFGLASLKDLPKIEELNRS